MKYVKLFEQIDWSTRFGKQQSIKNVQQKKKEEIEYKNNFFAEFPKKVTKLFFEDKYTTYELYFHDLKIIGEMKILVFKTDSGKDILIKNGNIEEKYLEEISILPINIQEESQELLNRMANFKKIKESVNFKKEHRLRNMVSSVSKNITDEELDELEVKLPFDKYFDETEYEYSGNFILSKDVNERDKAAENMCCGIITRDIKMSNNELIYFAFDYGH